MRLRRISRARPRFRQSSTSTVDETDETRARRPTTRDPGQDLQSQSLPLLNTMHVVLCMERTSCLSHVMLVLRVQGKGAAEGEVSREREASRKGALPVSACWPFEVKFQKISKWSALLEVSSFPQR